MMSSRYTFSISSLIFSNMRRAVRLKNRTFALIPTRLGIASRPLVLPIPSIVELLDPGTELGPGFQLGSTGY